MKTALLIIAATATLALAGSPPFTPTPTPKAPGLTTTEDSAAAATALGLINQWKGLAQVTLKALDEGTPANPQNALPAVSADKLKKALGPDAEKILRQVAKQINGD